MKDWRLENELKQLIHLKSYGKTRYIIAEPYHGISSSDACDNRNAIARKRVYAA
jgi:hypothetical protein